MTRTVHLVLLVALGLGQLPGLSSAAQEPAELGSESSQPRDTLLVGAGNVVGLAYPVAGAVARVVSDAVGTGRPALAAVSTSGSMENIVRLRAGDIDMAIVGADTLNDAVQGIGAFAEAGPSDDLRVLAALQVETVAVLTRRDGGIATIGDLVGKRVNLGPSGSLARSLTERILAFWNIVPDDLAEAGDADLGSVAADLCGGRWDAAVVVAAQPSGSMLAATGACDVAVVALAGEETETILRETPYLAAAQIPAGLYGGIDEPVQTVGMPWLLISSEAMPNETARAVVSALVENVEALRLQVPQLAGLDPATMAGLTGVAPLHSGALAVFDPTAPTAP